MKIEQVLIHYLLRNKKLALQGLGVFSLDASLADTADMDKPVVVPEGAISFHYDPRTPEDEGLVDYIVETTRKIRPLAASDLDSYLMLGRQFLNIGNPFILPNIGTLQKVNSGELVFKSGQYAFDKIGEQRDRNEEMASEDTGEEVLDYSSVAKPKNGKSVLIAIVVLVLLLAAWALWKYVIKSEPGQPKVLTTDAIIPVTDSVPPADTTTFQSNTLIADTIGFKVVVNEYNNLQAAQRRVDQLKTYRRNVQLLTDDSIVYKVAEIITNPLSDSSSVLDSLARYYGRNALRIER